MKRFIVTGCPRSGTAYAAALFTELGVRCDHETVFGIEQALGKAPVNWNGAQGDSSFVAVPFLPLADDIVVLHQVRHPLNFARSVVGIGFLSEKRRGKPWPSVVEKHAPQVYGPDRQAERAAMLWRVWNTEVEQHADITYRLEDYDTALVMRLAELLELDITEEQAAAALERVPRTTNQKYRHERVPWSRIEPIVGELAAHYGYEPPADSD